jgi:hypothetical protein
MRKLFLALFLIISVISSCHHQSTDENLFDDSAVTKLMILLDSIATRNAGYERVIAQPDTPPSENGFFFVYS